MNSESPFKSSGVCRGSDWFPLRSNQLAVVRWRGRLLGPVPCVAELRLPWPFFYVFDVFWLLSCRIVRVRSGPSSSSFVGARGAEFFDGAPRR